jgi:hypothetical protein
MPAVTDPDTAILFKGQEDFAGLWEIPAVVGSPADATSDRAATLVRDLLARGLIQLVWGDPNPREGGALSPREAEEVICDSSWWRGDRPLTGRQVWLYTTPVGERRLAGSGG